MRNRPAELANAAEPDPDPRGEQISEMVHNFLKNGKPQAEIADQVITAIRDDKLYIITHSEMDGIIKTRFDNVLARQNPVPRVLAAEAPRPQTSVR